ncbi:10965_t:CDS:2 [Entrophospora sp. SA101]|nr:10965_t:CDS:2 [Entrophospora sp. SA101]
MDGFNMNNAIIWSCHMQRNPFQKGGDFEEFHLDFGEFKVS